MVYKPMFNESLLVLVYELQHFMQWGTPNDLSDYVYWSGAFRRLNDKKVSIKQSGILLMPMAGIGSRFEEAGYSKPKPLIEVSGVPMAERALRNLPRTDEQIFVLRKDTQYKKQLVDALSISSLNPKFVTIDSSTDGQASTCIEGIKSANRETCVTISACDHGILYDGAYLESLLHDASVDVIVWGAVGYPGAIHSPDMYGWVEWNECSGKISSISVKTPLKDPRTDPIVVGTFTFKTISDFTIAVSRMKSRGALINGEYYVDTAINDAIALGLNCVLFLVDYYLCWGTPNDLNTYQYWEECFENWEHHPYGEVG
jgi:dTDP-glucose pyrophosphorylase